MAIRMTAGECAAILGGKIVSGKVSDVLEGISIDTRTVHAGNLFFAIHGPRFDGHDFTSEAFCRGAAGAVVTRDIALPASGFVIEVPDTDESLLKLAAHRRRQWGKRLAAVTGSSGKTTTKEMLAHLLEGRFRVHRSPGNFNNLFGLSQALLGLEDQHEVAVVELGMSAPGEIAQLGAAASPDLGILTNVAPVHLEFFASIEEIAEAKGELIGSLAAGGTLVYNADDARVAQLAQRYQGPRIGFGAGEGAEFKLVEGEDRGLEGSRLLVCWGRDREELCLPLLGSHNVLNFLAAAAAASAWGVPLAEQAVRALSLQPAAHRGAVLKFREGFAVVDDVYNSNPAALRQMIGWLVRTQGFLRRVVVAGEMLELGPDSEHFHAECGRMAAESGVDLLLGVRGCARVLCAAAVAAGMSETQSRFCSNTEEAGDLLVEALRPGDLVLIKGSRGVRLEGILDRLITEFTLDRA